MDEVRISSTARYSTGGFTPTTTPFASDANTSLLCHMDTQDVSRDGGGAGNYHIPTFASTNTQLDTASKKWGTASLLLDGSSHGLTIPDSADWDICADNTENWTVDFQISMASHSIDYEPIFNQNDEGNNDRLGMVHSHDEGLCFFANTGGATIIQVGPLPGEGTEGVITDSNWHHVALIKVGTDWGIYLDGVQKSYTSDASEDSYASILRIGSETLGPRYLNGHLDEFRIQKSNYFGAAPVVGLTDTITVPTAEYDTSSPASPRVILIA
jgi:hypothetical protein